MQSPCLWILYPFISNVIWATWLRVERCLIHKIFWCIFYILWCMCNILWYMSNISEIIKYTSQDFEYILQGIAHTSIPRYCTYICISRYCTYILHIRIHHKILEYTSQDCRNYMKIYNTYITKKFDLKLPQMN